MLLRNLFLLVALPAIVAARDFVVTDHGAIADGVTLNTVAIQSAIDAAQSAGGGRVVIPAGTFRSGSIFLKPGVELHLAEGAALLGSNRIDDYPKLETRIEGHFEPWRMALVNAERVDGLRISGTGRLDGNGIMFWASFWQRRRENPRCTNLEVERPRLMFIDRCNDVRIEGISLRDSGFWNIHLYRCRDVIVESVTIAAPGQGSPVRAPSSDGIDIDSCQRVTVRACTFSVDDDCIALKGTKGPLADRDESSPPVEDILVEGCTFNGGHGVLTCGSEATIVRRVTVRDCVVNGQNNLVRLKLRPDTPQRYSELLFENIKLSGSGRIFDVNPWTQFFDLRGQEPPARSVANVTLRNITGNYGSWGRIVGNPGDSIGGIHLENISLRLTETNFARGSIDDFQATNVTINGEPFTQ